MKPPVGNLKRLRTLLEASDFDAVVALSPENFPFTAGCFIWTQARIRDRMALTVWVKGEPEPVVIVCQVEEPRVRVDSWAKDIRSYVEFHQSPMEQLTEVLVEEGVAEGRVGVEMKYISAASYRELTERLPKAHFAPCEDLFHSARMIKTSTEIDLLTRAGRATEKALQATYATVEPEETEKSMADRLAAHMRRYGLDHVNFLFINAGANTCLSHLDATNYRAQPGDLVKSDVGGLLQGYVSDVARTAVVGPPSSEQLSVFTRLVEIHAETIEMARPGNRACDLYNTAKEGHAKRSLPLTSPHAGHGVGLEVHEEPLLTGLNMIEFEPNMIICVETRYRWAQKDHHHIEDLVLITEEGPRVLTTHFDSRELFVI